MMHISVRTLLAMEIIHSSLVMMKPFPTSLWLCDTFFDTDANRKNNL